MPMRNQKGTSTVLGIRSPHVAPDFVSGVHGHGHGRSGARCLPLRPRTGTFLRFETRCVSPRTPTTTMLNNRRSLKMDETRPRNEMATQRFRGAFVRARRHTTQENGRRLREFAATRSGRHWGQKKRWTKRLRKKKSC
jgi:hypothetical protein